MGLPLELLSKQGIVIGQDVSGWKEVQGIISLLLAELLIPFDVLDHEVLAGELHVVGEVVDELVWLQSDAIVWLEYLMHSLYRRPVDVPSLPVPMVLLPLSSGKIANNTVVVKVRTPTNYHIRVLKYFILEKQMSQDLSNRPAVHFTSLYSSRVHLRLHAQSQHREERKQWHKKERQERTAHGSRARMYVAVT